MSTYPLKNNLVVNGDFSVDIGSPTLLEFWNAANAVYGDNGEGQTADTAPPTSTGLTLLLDSGQINANWISDGFFGQAFLDAAGSVIISFEGSILNLRDQSSYAKGSRGADLAISIGLTPSAFIDAHTFADDVQQYLALHSLGSHPIYLTGHSLGGAEAEYVASLDHYNGVTFGAPGTLRPTYKAAVAGQTFINYVDFGDPVGNFGFHFSRVQEVGPVTDRVIWFSLDRSLGSTAGDLAAARLFHPLSHYATDLGLSPPPSTATIQVANDMITLLQHHDLLFV
jgi:hypothetical protein